MKALIDGDGATGSASFAPGGAREPSLDAPDPTSPSTPLPSTPPSPAPQPLPLDYNSTDKEDEDEDEDENEDEEEKVCYSLFFCLYLLHMHFLK